MNVRRDPRGSSGRTCNPARAIGAALMVVVSALPARAQVSQQTQADDYTRYELLAPGSEQFRIVYDVTATTPGAPFFYNVIRKGSVASDESVVDLASGKPLQWEVVPGRDARANGLPGADLDTDYIRIRLARPVARGGEARLRIFKTYKDAKSYYREGELIVFARVLSIRRNAVVLPAGFELVSCNMPSQVLTESDGRIALSFQNTNPDPVSLVVQARPLPPNRKPRPSTTGSPAATVARGTVPSVTDAPSLERSARLGVSERAFQDREIVYLLQPPATHAFDLYHDYTETRPGVSTYVNVVRAGSRVSKPLAVNLDTGETLAVETLKGDAARSAKLDLEEAVTPDTEVVVVRFPAVEPGTSMRLRISETYTDPLRYGTVDGVLVWHRELGRPRNRILLPAGWFLTTSSIPVVVSPAPDGRVQLDYENARPDAIDVILRAMER